MRERNLLVNILKFKAPSTSIRFRLKTQLFLYGCGLRPHVSDKNYRQKRNFSKRFPEWNFLKTILYCIRQRVDGRQRNFSKTLMSHYQFQSSPFNIRNQIYL